MAIVVEIYELEHMDAEQAKRAVEDDNRMFSDASTVFTADLTPEDTSNLLAHLERGDLSIIPTFFPPPSPGGNDVVSADGD